MSEMLSIIGMDGHIVADLGVEDSGLFLYENSFDTSISLAGEWIIGLEASSWVIADDTTENNVFGHKALKMVVGADNGYLLHNSMPDISAGRITFQMYAEPSSGSGVPQGLWGCDGDNGYLTYSGFFLDKVATLSTTPSRTRLANKISVPFAYAANTIYSIEIEWAEDGWHHFRVFNENKTVLHYGIHYYDKSFTTGKAGLSRADSSGTNDVWVRNFKIEELAPNSFQKIDHTTLVYGPFSFPDYTDWDAAAEASFIENHDDSAGANIFGQPCLSISNNGAGNIHLDDAKFLGSDGTLEWEWYNDTNLASAPPWGVAGSTPFTDGILGQVFGTPELRIYEYISSGFNQRVEPSPALSLSLDTKYRTKLSTWAHPISGQDIFLTVEDAGGSIIQAIGYSADVVYSGNMAFSRNVQACVAMLANVRVYKDA